MAQQVPFPQNPGEHGEGRNRQGRAHKEQRGKGVVAGEQLGLPGFEHQGQQDPQRQGHPHPYGGNSACQGQAALQQLGVELKPNQEHEQHQPQLTEHV